MRTMSNYLIIIFSVIIFIFRLIVLFTATLGIDFIVEPINIEYEIALLFVMLLSIILMSKKKLIGAIMLLIASVVYFGPSLLEKATYMSTHTADIELIIDAICSLICIIVSIFAFFITAFAKEQEKRPVDKKTDFFYKNEAYDREYDKRADRNNYRIM